MNSSNISNSNRQLPRYRPTWVPQALAHTADSGSFKIKYCLESLGAFIIFFPLRANLLTCKIRYRRFKAIEASAAPAAKPTPTSERFASQEPFINTFPSDLLLL